jgi:hypothetical protein
MDQRGVETVFDMISPRNRFFHTVSDIHAAERYRWLPAETKRGIADNIAAKNTKNTKGQTDRRMTAQTGRGAPATFRRWFD